MKGFLSQESDFQPDWENDLPSDTFPTTSEMEPKLMSGTTTGGHSPSSTSSSSPASSPAVVPSSTSPSHHPATMVPVMHPLHQLPPITAVTSVSEDGLILPRKILNPCLESRERVDLHRELRFNAKAYVMSLLPLILRFLFVFLDLETVFVDCKNKHTFLSLRSEKNILFPSVFSVVFCDGDTGSFSSLLFQSPDSIVSHASIDTITLSPLSLPLSWSPCRDASPSPTPCTRCPFPSLVVLPVKQT